LEGRDEEGARTLESGYTSPLAPPAGAYTVSCTTMFVISAKSRQIAIATVHRSCVIDATYVGPERFTLS